MKDTYMKWPCLREGGMELKGRHTYDIIMFDLIYIIASTRRPLLFTNVRHQTPPQISSDVVVEEKRGVNEIDC